MKWASRKSLIYTGPSSVIHDSTTDLVKATEDQPYCLEPEQTVYYTHTKAVGEKLILDANRKNGLLTVAIRGATFFGENDNVMPTHIGNARAGRNRLQVGDGKNLYDWTYVGNLAHGHLLTAEALLRVDVGQPTRAEDEAMRVDGEAFVITNDEPWPFWKFVRRVGEVAGYPTREEDVWVVPGWLFYGIAVLAEWGVWITSFGGKESNLNRVMVKYLTRERTFDIEKAKARLGYRPKVSVEEGIQSAVRAFLESDGPGTRKGH